MMLHVRSIKTEIIKKLQEKVTMITKCLNCEEIILNEKVNTYIGVKLHHGYVFLINEETTITYPRGVHGRIIKEVYKSIKENKVHGIVYQDGKKLKVKPKKNFEHKQ